MEEEKKELSIEELQEQILNLSNENKELKQEKESLQENLTNATNDLNKARELNAQLVNRYLVKQEPVEETRVDTRSFEEKILATQINKK